MRVTFKKVIYIYIYIYIHVHVYVYVCVCIVASKLASEKWRFFHVFFSKSHI
jgi:hypothetical protein